VIVGRISRSDVYERRSSATTFHRQAHYVYANAPKLQPAFFIILPVDFEFSDRQGYEQCLPITKLNAYMQIFQSYCYLFFLKYYVSQVISHKIHTKFSFSAQYFIENTISCYFVYFIWLNNFSPKTKDRQYLAIGNSFSENF